MREPAQRTQLMGPSPECRTVSLLPSQPCTPRQALLGDQKIAAAAQLKLA